MGKAILVLDDMPQTCEQCQFYRRSSEPLYDAYVCEATKSLISARSHDCKPAWCRVKELPEKFTDNNDYQENAVTIRDNIMFAKGWNACLDEICGKDE